MQEILDEPVSLGKVFNEKSIWIASFLAGPLVAGFMLSINFKRIGKTEASTISLIFGFVILIGILMFSFLVPAADNIPNILFSIAYAWGAYIVYQRTQKKEILNHIRSGGEVYSWWIVALIILIGVLIFIGIFLLIFMFEDGSTALLF